VLQDPNITLDQLTLDGVGHRGDDGVLGVELRQASLRNADLDLSLQGRWRETGSHDVFAEPGYLDFYRGLAADCGGTEGWVQVSALFVGEDIVATHWGMAHGRRFYWIMPGYEDGEWGRYSVGRVLMDAVVQDCIARGFALFDLTVGDEAYKTQWADHELALASFEAGVSWRGKGVVALRRLLRAAKEKARSHRGLRNLVRRLSGKAPL
jgi:CelD/BcsL family acetyltransferase involved in cellulose biosynthesis